MLDGVFVFASRLGRPRVYLGRLVGLCVALLDWRDKWHAALMGQQFDEPARLRGHLFEFLLPFVDGLFEFCEPLLGVLDLQLDSVDGGVLSMG
jgi:hypothetical protein